MVLDLEGVSFMDSSALGVLVYALRQVDAQGGALRLAARASRCAACWR
ncbi:STAS domain-containing protein [Streptomyces sp. T1317-0309]|nr:STAS domain-containing protein [Streptomyces sp. T1317-0309]